MTFDTSIDLQSPADPVIDAFGFPIAEIAFTPNGEEAFSCGPKRVLAPLATRTGSFVLRHGS